MKRKAIFNLLLVTLLSTTLLTGCGNPKTPVTASTETSSEVSSEAASNPFEAKNPSSEATSSSEEEIDPETMEYVKYNIYVQLNNYIIKVLDNLQNYYTVVSDADEFTMLPDSGYSYGFGITGLNNSIVDDSLVVAAMEPAFEDLDPLVLQLADSMKILMDTFSNISKSNDYADNQYAKAKEYHTIIQANVSTFVTPAYDFLDALTIVANERVAIEEEQMLADERLIAYNASHAITIGNKLIDECYNQEVDDYNLIELDLTTIKPLYEELVTTVDAYKAAINDNDQLIKESLTSSSSFDGLLDSLIQAVEWMIQQVESQTPLDDPSREQLGSLNHINEVLSSCISRYNSVFAES